MIRHFGLEDFPRGNWFFGGGYDTAFPFQESAVSARGKTCEGWERLTSLEIMFPSSHFGVCTWSLQLGNSQKLTRTENEWLPVIIESTFSKKISRQKQGLAYLEVLLYNQGPRL